MTDDLLKRLLALPEPGDYPAWLRAKRRQFRRLLGEFPNRDPVQARVEDRQIEDDHIVERVVYETEPGEQVPAIILVPRHREPPFPAVVCLHQHAGQWELGKSEVVGHAGNPEQAYAKELCYRGYVTISPDALGFEERRDASRPGEEQERLEATRLLLQGSTLMGKMVWDATRALDYLETRPEVDRNRIGCIGHSMGGYVTWAAMAADSRIQVGVSSCGISTFAAIMREKIIHSLVLLIPGLLKWGDVPEVIATLAPRPFLIVSAQEDRLFPRDGIEEVHWRAHQLYSRLGAADRLGLFLAPGPHAFTADMRAWAYQWFDRWL